MAARGIEIDADLRRRVEQRLRLALGRYQGGIASVRLSLTRPDPDSKDIVCRVAIRCADGERLQIEESAPEVDGAADVAVWRLQHLLRRRALD